MTTTGDLRIDDWVVHRPNVVRSVAARVPGIDAEEATSRALEKMVRLATTGTTINDPAPYWRRAAVNEAISMTREAGRTHPVEDNTLDGLAPPVEGAELNAERQADVTMLRTALSDLTDDDRTILLDRHVHDMAITDIAGHLGVRPHAVTMRLRRAEERLAGAFAAAHAHTVNEPECRTTRAAMHDYLKGRLLPRRQRRLEVHMDTCGECTRAFIDVREVSWMLRDLGQHIIGGPVATGALGGLAGTAGAGAASVAGTSGPGGQGTTGTGRPPSFSRAETVVAAGVLAALALTGVAAAYVATQPDTPVVEAVQEPEPPAAAPGPGTGDDGPDPRGQDRGPSPSEAEPAQDPPRPAPADVAQLQPPAATTKDSAPVPAPAPAPAPVTVPARHVVDREVAVPPAAERERRPGPDDGTDRPAPTRRPTAPPPTPEMPPRTSPPEREHRGGPPGNPENTHGKGPAKDKDRGPGGDNRKGPGGPDSKGPGRHQSTAPSGRDGRDHDDRAYGSHDNHDSREQGGQRGKDADRHQTAERGGHQDGSGHEDRGGHEHGGRGGHEG